MTLVALSDSLVYCHHNECHMTQTLPLSWGSSIENPSTQLMAKFQHSQDCHQKLCYTVSGVKYLLLSYYPKCGLLTPPSQTTHKSSLLCVQPPSCTWRQVIIANKSTPLPHYEAQTLLKPLNIYPCFINHLHTKFTFCLYLQVSAKRRTITCEDSPLAAFPGVFLRFPSPS